MVIQLRTWWTWRSARIRGSLKSLLWNSFGPCELFLFGLWTSFPFYFVVAHLVSVMPVLLPVFSLFPLSHACLLCPRLLVSNYPCLPRAFGRCAPSRLCQFVCSSRRFCLCSHLSQSVYSLVILLFSVHFCLSTQSSLVVLFYPLMIALCFLLCSLELDFVCLPAFQPAYHRDCKPINLIKYSSLHLHALTQAFWALETKKT